MKTTDIDALKTFRKQRRLLDAMLQQVKVFLINPYAQKLQHDMFKGVAPKAFSGIHIWYLS